MILATGAVGDRDERRHRTATKASSRKSKTRVPLSGEAASARLPG